MAGPGPLIVTLVRHGESQDNLLSIWAGHKDAPLTVHGFEQARRLGVHFKETQIHAIYASDLKRAHTTARAVHSANTINPEIPFTVSTHLREQYFGEAEGQPWDGGSYSSSARNNLDWESSRQFTLAPSAESLNDVGRRADAVLRHFITPHALESASNEQQHIMIFAHGLFLSEMMFALQRCATPDLKFVKSSTYTNTGWSRVEISLLSPPSPSSSHPPASTIPHHVTSGNALASTGKLPPPFDGESLPEMRVKVLATNQVEHLEGLIRQKGGIGSMAHDDKQKGIKEFFGTDKLG